MKEKLIEILNDCLCVKRQTLTQQIKILKNGNRDILCSVRLLSYLKNISLLNNDFDLTIKLSTFIRNSWTDVESSDEQINNIADYVIDLIHIELQTIN
jgi:NifB/MoaA-like Fe-S oxidoreductase